MDCMSSCLSHTKCELFAAKLIPSLNHTCHYFCVCYWAFVRGIAKLYTSGLCMLLFTHRKGSWTGSTAMLLFFILFHFVFILFFFLRFLLISSWTSMCQKNAWHGSCFCFTCSLWHVPDWAEAVLSINMNPFSYFISGNLNLIYCIQRDNLVLHSAIYKGQK